MTSAATEVEVGRAERLSDRVNPIVVKEIRQALRGDSFFKSLWGVLLLSALAGAFALTFASNIAPPEMVGAAFFMTVYVCMCIALMGLTPIAAFQSLSSEWDDDSFELLVASDLGPGQIVRGKLYSALIQGGLVGVAFLPMLAVALTLPGLNPVAGLLLLTILAVAGVLATALALGIASLARRRPVRILALGLLVASSFAMVAILINVSTLSVASPDDLLSTEALSGMGAMAAAAIFITGYAVLVAQSQVAHPEENKSTPLRKWTVAAALVGCVVLGLMHLGAPLGSDLLQVGGFLLTLGLGPALYFFATESRRVPRRVEYQLRAGGAPRLPDLMVPGGSRGLLLAWVLLPLTFAMLAGIGLLFGGLDELNAAFLCALYLLAYLSLGALFTRVFARGGPTARVRIAFLLVIIAGLVVPGVVGAALGDMDLAGGRHLFNPFYTVAEYGDEDFNLVVAAGPMTLPLYGLALLGFVLNLRAVIAGVRERSQLQRRTLQS